MPSRSLHNVQKMHPHPFLISSTLAGYNRPGNLCDDRIYAEDNDSQRPRCRSTEPVASEITFAHGARYLKAPSPGLSCSHSTTVLLPPKTGSCIDFFTSFIRTWLAFTLTVHWQLTMIFFCRLQAVFSFTFEHIQHPLSLSTIHFLSKCSAVSPLSLPLRAHCQRLLLLSAVKFHKVSKLSPMQRAEVYEHLRTPFVRTLARAVLDHCTQ